MEKQWGSGWQKHRYSLKATAVWILQMAWAVSTGTTSARYCQHGEDVWAGAAFQHQLCLLCSLHEKQLHQEGKQLRVTIPWSLTFSPGPVDLQLQRWLKMISTNNLNWPHGEILTNRKSNLSRKLQRNHSLSKQTVCDPWGIYTNLYQTRLSLLWRQNGTTTMLSWIRHLHRCREANVGLLDIKLASQLPWLLKTLQQACYRWIMPYCLRIQRNRVQALCTCRHKK